MIGGQEVQSPWGYHQGATGEDLVAYMRLIPGRKRRPNSFGNGLDLLVGEVFGVKTILQCRSLVRQVIHGLDLPVGRYCYVADLLALSATGGLVDTQ